MGDEPDVAPDPPPDGALPALTAGILPVARLVESMSDALILLDRD